MKKNVATEPKVIAQRGLLKQLAITLAGSTDRKEKDATAAALFRLLHPKLLHFFARTGGSGLSISDNEDIVLITLEKVFANIHMYDPNGGEFSTWVFRVATNARIDWFRRKVRSVSIDEPIKVNEEDMLIEIKSQGPDPMSIALKGERASLVVEALSKMGNATERHLLYLRFFQEYSYREIADEMEMPMGTVKAMIHRAKESVIALLSPSMAIS